MVETGDGERRDERGELMRRERLRQLREVSGGRRERLRELREM